MVKPGDEGPSPWSSSGEEDPESGTERQIFEAADRVFARRGTDGARMQEIAEEAGVNKALLHYYYRSKRKLAEAVFRRTVERFVPTVVEIMSSDLDLDQKVERVVHGYLDLFSRRPYLPGYLISEITHHPDRLPRLFHAVAGPHFERRVLPALKRQIDAGVEEGDIVAIPPEQFLVNVVSLCVFPFAARPMLVLLLGLDEAGFEAFVEERRRDLPGFVMRALSP
ncbi:MAG: TetR/AcrR family transcriptional regulator [Thermoanaerobaculia bacterium]|nr:TetR/AcrR family transcriptional regulator [Thermoanaerobaculia bacterium]